MVETILHTLGFCNDSFSHLDLSDVVLGGLGGFVVFIKYYGHCAACKAKNCCKAIKDYCCCLGKHK